MDTPPQLGTVLRKRIPFRSKVKPLRKIMLCFLSHNENRAYRWAEYQYPGWAIFCSQQTNWHWQFLGSTWLPNLFAYPAGFPSFPGLKV